MRAVQHSVNVKDEFDAPRIWKKEMFIFLLSTPFGPAIIGISFPPKTTPSPISTVILFLEVVDLTSNEKFSCILVSLIFSSEEWIISSVLSEPFLVK